MARGIDELRRLATTLENVGSRSSQDELEKLHPFDERNIHEELIALSKKLFDNGHYSQATFEAFKFLDKTVEHISGLNEQGKSLMMKAFKEDSPVIKLNPLATESDENEQEGYKFLFAGAIVGIRNPRGHEYGKTDTLEECLDHLSLASMLLRTLDARLEP